MRLVVVVVRVLLAAQIICPQLFAVTAAAFIGPSSSSSFGRTLSSRFSSPSRTTTTAAAALLFSKTTTEDDAAIIMESLTPELARMTSAFEAIGDDKLRYKQLLYMANQLPAMPKSSMIPENKVPGCLSTVYIDGTVETKNDSDNETVKIINFTGDSDGLLTKGLVALLVRGLSGSSASDIQKVDPAFIERAGISASLTPGRNNGFLNMLASMKRKALELESGATASSTDASSGATNGDSSSSSSSSNTPIYDAMMETLQKLQPTRIKLTNVSHQHAGHAGMDGASSNNTDESHFELDIVADAFDGLNLVKRHQLVYMLLSEIMPQIHALQIQAKTPAEVGE